MFRNFLSIGAALLLIASSLAVTAVPPTPVWELGVAGRAAGVPSVHNGVIYLGAGNQLYAVNLDGTVKWQRELVGEVSAQVRVEDGILYVHSTEGLTSFNVMGEQQWHYANKDTGPMVEGAGWSWGDGLFTDPWAMYRSTPLVAENLVYFGSSDGLYALDKETGKKIGHVAIGAVTADIARYEGSVIVGSWDNKLYSFDIKTGKRNWAFEARLPAGSSADWSGWRGFHLTPVVSKKAIFVGTRGTDFYVINAEDGTEAFSSKSGSSWIGSPALVTEDQYYFGLSAGHAIEGHSRAGATQTLFIPFEAPMFAQPVATETHMFVGTLTGEILVVDLKDNSLVATINTNEDRVSWFKFFEKDENSKLTPHEQSVHDINRMLKERNAIMSMTIADNILYVGTGSGKLAAYAVDTLTK